MLFEGALAPGRGGWGMDDGIYMLGVISCDGGIVDGTESGMISMRD